MVSTFRGQLSGVEYHKLSRGPVLEASLGIVDETLNISDEVIKELQMRFESSVKKIEELDGARIFVNPKHGPFLSFGTVKHFFNWMSIMAAVTLLFFILWTVYTHNMYESIDVDTCGNPMINVFYAQIRLDVTYLIIMVSLFAAQLVFGFWMLKSVVMRLNPFSWFMVFAMGIFTFLLVVQNYVNFNANHAYIVSEGGRICGIEDNLYYSFGFPATSVACYCVFIGSYIAFHVVVLYRSMQSVANPMNNLSIVVSGDSAEGSLKNRAMKEMDNLLG